LDSQKISGFGLRLVEASLRLGEKGTVIFITDTEMNAVEFFDDIPDGEGCQISQSTVPLIKKVL